MCQTICTSRLSHKEVYNTITLFAMAMPRYQAFFKKHQFRGLTRSEDIVTSQTGLFQVNIIYKDAVY